MILALIALAVLFAFIGTILYLAGKEKGRKDYEL